MKRNAIRIVLAFFALFLTGLIFEPNIFFPILGLLILLAPFCGLSWLIFRRCKFTLGQLMASLFLFGAAMSISSHFDSSRNNNDQLVYAIVFVPIIGVGMFLGARAALKSAPEDNLRRWGFFLSGLLLPGSLLSFLWLLTHARDLEWQIAIVMDFVLILVTFWTIIKCISMQSKEMKEPERIKPKICPDRV
jgi:hypothetical protein